MKRQFLRVISMLLSFVLLVSFVPTAAWAVLAEELIPDQKEFVGYPVADHDGLILEFRNELDLEQHRRSNGGQPLGGNMLLVDGSYQEAKNYEKMTSIRTVTYNYLVEAAGYAEIYGSGRDVQKDDPDLDSDILAFWLASAEVADSVPNLSLHTTRVAVMDTGIDATHDELVGHVAEGYDALEDAVERRIEAGANSEISDSSHGTMVAGLIAAEVFNGVGISGAVGAFPVELVPIRVLNENGKGKIADIVRGIYWAIDNDIDVLNMSFGARMEYYPTALANAIRDARAQNILPIAAAGNEYGMTWQGYYPACLEGCYPVMSGTVGMVNNYTSSFSNTFPVGSVPGQDYTSIDGENRTSTTLGNTYGTFTGTSASCALITGYASVVMSLMGGKSNPATIETVLAVFTYAHTTNTNLIPYSLVPRELDSAVKACVTAELIGKAGSAIWGSVECNDILKAEAPIVAKITYGADAVGDVTLALYDAMDQLVYLSEPVVGTGASSYELSLDTTVMTDGRATVVVYCRTADEVAAGTEPTQAAHSFRKRVDVQNNLIAEYARIRLYDEYDQAFAATVYVTDPMTGELVATVYPDEDGILSIERRIFFGGELTFTCICAGVYYQKTAAFASEITLGGDEVQTTVISFAGDEVTLSGVTAYTKAPDGSFISLGVTDENGEMLVSMSDITMPMIVVDGERNYILSVTAEQDGNQMQFSFADAVNNAKEITVSAVSSIAEEDRYALSVSYDPLFINTDGVATAILTKSQNTFRMYGDSLYVMVAVYDVFYREDGAGNKSDYRFYYTAHNLGCLELDTMTAIDFNPCTLVTVLDVEKTELRHGENTPYALQVIDNKGNPVIGGYEQSYDTMEFPIVCGEWYGSQDYSFMDQSRENDYQWQVENGVIYTLTDYGMALPTEEGYYIFGAKCYIDTYSMAEYLGCAGFLAYEAAEVNQTIHVLPGSTLELILQLPEGASDTWVQTENIVVFRDGTTENAGIISQDWETKTYTINTLGYEAGTKIAAWVTVYFNEMTSLGVYQYCYPIVITYDPENPTYTATMPDVEFGVTNIVMNGMILYNTTLMTVVDGLTLSISGGGECAYPAGVYSVLVADRDEENRLVLGYEEYTNPAGQSRTIELETTNFNQITIDKADMTSITVYPVVDGVLYSWPQEHMGQLWDMSTVLLVAPRIESLVARFRTMEYDYMGGISWMTALPLTATEPIMLDAQNSWVSTFEAYPEKLTFKPNESVIVRLNAALQSGVVLQNVRSGWFAGGKSVEEADLTPFIKYRKAGGSWQMMEFADWCSVNLGKLAAGTYEAVVGVKSIEIPMDVYESTFVFVVDDAAAGNTVILSAPDQAAGEVEILVSGIKGAVITLSYTAPNGTKKVLQPFTMPESGIYRVAIPLTLEGEYVFSAVSVLDGEADSEAENIVVTNSFAVPGPIENFVVTGLNDGSLKLTWQAPAGAEKLLLYRDGEVLGYIPIDITTYTDNYANLNLSRTYTYMLVAENGAGRKGTPVYAQGKPALVADTQAPTAPAALTAEAAGMTAMLTWTRSTDNVGVVGYRVYRDGTLVYDGVKRTFADEGLSRSTEYVYTVTAYDSAGNESAVSPSARVVTGDTYTIDAFRVNLKTNRVGDITDDRLDVVVSVGDAQRVIVRVVYRSKNAEELTFDMELAHSGAFWTGAWDFSRVYQILSMTAYAYEGETVVAQKEAAGFPRAVSSGIGAAVTVTNATYAPVAMKGMEIVLRQAESGACFRLPVGVEEDTGYYQFEHLGAGTYTLTVEYTEGGRLHELYRQENVLLENGVEKVLAPITIHRFIRIHQDYDQAVYGFDLTDTQTDDGYLIHEGDSAFFVNKDTSVITLRSLWEGKSILVDDVFYTVPSSYPLALSEGVTSYDIDTLAAAQTEQSKQVRIRFNTNEDFSLEGLEVTLSWHGGSGVYRLDASNEVLATVPASAATVDYRVPKQVYSLTGGASYVLDPVRSWIVLDDSPVYEILLWLRTTAAVKLQFTCDAPMSGIKGYALLTGSTSFVLGDDGMAVLAVDGHLNSRLHVAIYSTFIGDYYIPSQSFYVEYTSADTVYTLPIKAQLKKERPIRLTFTDAHGYSLEGVGVTIYAEQETHDFVLGADGILETTLDYYGNLAPVTIQTFGRKDNLIWKTSTYILQADENEKSIVLQSSAEIPISGNYFEYDFDLYTGTGADMKVTRLNTSSSTAFYLDSALLDANVWLVAVPTCQFGEWYDNNMPAAQRLALWQKLTPDNVFELNAETITKPIRVKNVEYYTINSTKDLVGNPISAYIRAYVYVEDTLVLNSTLPLTGVRIPKFSDNQRIVLIGGHQRLVLIGGHALTAQQVEEALADYRGTYCLEWIPDAQSAKTKDFVFGYQSVLQFELLDTEGEAHTDMINMAIAFDAEEKYVYHSNQLNNDLLEVLVTMGQSDFTVFFLWLYPYNGVDTMEDSFLRSYRYFDELGEQVTRITLDPCQPHPDPIVVKANFNPMVRLTSSNGNDLATNIKSVIKQNDGSYFVRMTQNGAREFQTLILLPDGAYNVTVDNEQQSSESILLEVGRERVNISFFISEEDLIADRNIRCYVLTAYGRSLQYIREIDYEIFIYGLRNSVSSNEVIFKSSTKFYNNSMARVLHEDAYVYSVFGQAYHFGSTWGLKDIPDIEGYTYLDLLDPESEFYDPDYSIEDYREEVGDSSGQGRWLTFDTKLYNFAVAMKVNGKPLALSNRIPYSVVKSNRGDFCYVDGMLVEYYRLENWFRSQYDTNLSTSLDTYDEELDCFFYSGGFLDKYNYYDPETGYGMLPIPMPEPDAYPANYEVEIYFRYTDADGIEHTECYTENIRMYYDAPILQKWYYQVHQSLGTQESSMHYFNITTREDRLDYVASRPQVRDLSVPIDSTDMPAFTFYAYFDKPQEVCNVYAVADIQGDSAECNYDRYIRLEYDEDIGCYVGTGTFGDAMHLPQAFNVVYELVAEQPYQGMPTVQLTDLFQTEGALNGAILNLENLPEGWTVTESGPENGWTLRETYQRWRLYGSILAQFAESGEVMTARDLRRVLDENMRLYLPIYNFYDQEGTYMFSLKNYYDFSEEVTAIENGFSVAIMDGAQHVSTLTQGMTVSEEDGEICLMTSAVDTSFMLPYVPADEVNSASLGSLIGKGASFLGQKAVSAGQYIHKSVEYTGKVEAVNMVAGLGFGARDLWSALSDAATAWGLSDLPEWAYDLTPKQFNDYMNYRQANRFINIASGSGALIVGTFATGVPGLITTVLFGVANDIAKAAFGDPEEIYQKIAAMNRDLLGENERVIGYLREHGFPDELEKLTMFHDPSGVIFEGIESNVLSGVTATVYYRDDQQGEWVKWDSALYGEGPNPGISDGYGHYGWDVLAGKWKVIFEKDGYYLAESVELDVPPAHLDVNISMVATVPAALSTVKAGAQGAYLDFTFDRPVLVEDVVAKATVLFGGEMVEGTIVALNAAETAFGNKQQSGDHDVVEGQWVATAFRFIPEEPMEIGTAVMLTVEKGVLTYNGLECDAMESAYVTIPENVADPITAFWYEGTATLAVGETLNIMDSLSVSGSEGTITFKSQDESIVTVDENGVMTAVGAGRTYIRMTCGEVIGVVPVNVTAQDHTHRFDVMNPLLANRASEATCTDAATYYYLCACGERGTETYVYGDPDETNHTGYALWVVTDTHHSIAYDCCGKICMGETLHSFDEDGVCIDGCGKSADEQPVVDDAITFGGNSASEDVNGLAFRFDVNVIGMSANGTVADYSNAVVVVDGVERQLLSMGAIVTNTDVQTLDKSAVNGTTVIDIAAVYLCTLEPDSAGYAVRVINIPDEGKDTTIRVCAYYVVLIDGVETVIYDDQVYEQSYNGVFA